jgi:hypothetical protein
MFVALTHSLTYFKSYFWKYIFIFGDIFTLVGEILVYVSYGNFRGFSAKTVLGIIILKSGLLGDFFSLGWQPYKDQ